MNDKRRIEIQRLLDEMDEDVRGAFTDILLKTTASMVERKVPMFIFLLGQLVKDKVTGFKGVITGRAEYMTGCRQYLVTPKSKTPDKISESAWLDEDRLSLIVDESGPKIERRNKGGPQMFEAPIK